MHRSLKNLAFAVVGLIFAAASNLAVAGDPAAWNVRSVSGQAEIQTPGGAWRPLETGKSVAVGDSIRTGNDGRAVIARDDESVTIAANGSFEIKPASTGMLTSVFQKIGTMMYKVHKRPDRHFEVGTPYLVAVVKGTTFTVSVDGNGSAVHVTAGLVEVGGLNGRDKLLLNPGQTGSIGSKPGSKIQSGAVTPEKDGASSAKEHAKAPSIKQPIESAALDIEKASNGLFKNAHSRIGDQVASTGSADHAADGQGVAGTVGAVTEGVGSAASGAANGVGAAAGGVGNGVGAATSGLGNGVGAAAGGVGGAVSGLASGVGSAAGGLGNGIGSTVSSLATGAGGAVGSVASGAGLGGTVSGLAGSINGGLGNVLGGKKK